MVKITIYESDNLTILRSLESSSIDLIYIDPPFNTGKIQSLKRIKTIADKDGDRIGFGGKLYKSKNISNHSYLDNYEDYIGFLEPLDSRIQGPLDIKFEDLSGQNYMW